MTFKAEWEKTEQHHELAEIAIHEMVKIAFPQSTLSSIQIIAGGCANLNVKIELASHSSPFILRVYLREKEAAFREQSLWTLLKEIIPLPEVIFIGDFENYRFALTEYISGITLRELLLSNENHDVQSLMYSAGTRLAQIQNFRFPHSGFLNHDLQVEKKITQIDYIEFSKDCLEQLTVHHGLDNETSGNIDYFVNHFQHFFPDIADNHLVHADFDPANILVDKRGGNWEISGILDWEFAYSGSPLNDIANMLRYAHHMPHVFERAFLEGVQTGYQLPDDWKLRVHMINLLALLDCLALAPADVRPRRCRDICSLIQYILVQLKKY